MILAGKNCVLVNSVQEFIETEEWLLLTFFLCLHNQSIVTYERVEIIGKGDSSNRQKMKSCSFQQVLQQNLSWFLLKHRKCFFLQV